MALVFAAAIVVLGVMGITLWRMFPLTRPQVFFLITQSRPNMAIRLYAPSSKRLKTDTALFEQSFIKEYVKARNEIFPVRDVMHRKWGTHADGVVKSWSDDKIYNAFANTPAWQQLMQTNAVIDFTCTVEFDSPAIVDRNIQMHEYEVRFNYICVNSDGQRITKQYKIIVQLDMNASDDASANASIKWGDRLNNPLGVRVIKYDVEDNGTDPLDL